MAASDVRMHPTEPREGWQKIEPFRTAALQVTRGTVGRPKLPSRPVGIPTVQVRPSSISCLTL